MRRVAVAALLVLLWVCPAHAAITASADAPNTTGSQANIDAFAALALTNGVATGDFIVGTCGIWQTAAGITGVTITDTVSTAYTVVMGSDVVYAAGAGNAVVFYGRAPSAGANALTINPSGVGNYGQCDVKKFSGVHVTTPLDVAWSESAGSSMTAADSLTTLTANDLLIGVGINPGVVVWAEGAGHTLLGLEATGNQTYVSEYRLVTTATSYTVDATINLTSDWIFGTIAFKEATAVTSCTRIILGLGPC